MKKPKRKPTKKELIRHELSGFLIQEIAAIYGITQQAVGQWGCPREKGGTLNLGEVIKWREAQLKQKPAGKEDLEKDKLRLQCEKMQIDIDRLKAETMPVEMHEQIMTSRAASLTHYMKEFFSRNIHQLVGKSLEDLRGTMTEWIAVMMNSYSSNHK
jgi:transposase